MRGLERATVPFSALVADSASPGACDAPPHRGRFNDRAGKTQARDVVAVMIMWRGGPGMAAQDDVFTARTRGTGVMPLATTAVVGTPARAYAPMLVPGTEP